MNVLIGITSDKRQPFFNIVENGCKKTFGSVNHPNCKVYFYYEGDFKVEGQDIFFPVPDLNAHRVGHMTLGFFKYILENENFDYLFKSSCSCYVNQKNLCNFLLAQPRQRFACGHILHHHDYNKNEDIKFITGSCSILSRDVVQKIYDNKDVWNHGNPEDVELCRLFEGYAELTPHVYRQDIETIDQVNNNIDVLGVPLNIKDNYCYRVKGYADPGERKIDVEIMKRLHSKMLLDN